MHYIESEVTKTSYLYRLSGSMRIQVMPMESGLCLSPPVDALVDFNVLRILCNLLVLNKYFYRAYHSLLKC
jgi:hypothetical protein